MVNTDDPGLFRTDLDNEYRIVADRMGFTRTKLAEVALNGLRISWLDETTKARRLAEWQTEIAPLLET
jgi:adenosine deaminase